MMLLVELVESNLATRIEFENWKKHSMENEFKFPLY